MTYDERQEIETYIGIIEKTSKRLERDIEMLKEKLKKTPCHAEKDEKSEK